MWKLIAFVLPLAADSFAVATLLGASGVSRSQRWRITALFTVFEAGMPLIGLSLGEPLAAAVGSAAGYVAAAALVAVGIWALVFGEHNEEEAARRLTGVRGWAVIGLGLSISTDGLAMGFSLGLVGLPVVPVIVAIGAQAFLAAQLGMAIGARAGQGLRKNAQRLAALALIGLGIFVLVQQLTSP